MAEPRVGTSPEGQAAPWQGRAYVGAADERGDWTRIDVLAPDGTVLGPLTFVDQWEHAREVYRDPVPRSRPGYAWGYLGAGPADTAASLLADHFGGPQPRSVVQRFKQEVVARLPHHGGWLLAAADIAAWAEANAAVLARAWAASYDREAGWEARDQRRRETDP